MNNSVTVYFNNKTQHYEVRRGKTLLFHNSSIARVRDYCRHACLSVNKNRSLVYRQAPTEPISIEEKMYERAKMNENFSI